MRKLKIGMLLLVFLTGCSGLSLQEENVAIEEVTSQEQLSEYEKLPINEAEKKNCSEQVLEAASLYQSFYKSCTSIGENQVKAIVAILGDKGYTVTDSDNKVNMKNSQRIDAFCKQVEAGENVTTTMYKVTIDGGLLRLDFQKDDDEMSVMHTVVSWNASKKPEVTYMERFKIYEWQYTSKGYLLYERSYEELAPFGMDYNKGHEAIRVEPLKDEYRELCKTYIEPISYQGNNLFLTNWNEEDLGQLQLNDLFEYLYDLKVGHLITLEEYNQGIEEKTFEELIITYFDISKRMLREHALYDEVTQKYTWSRGSSENCLFEIPPLPEVVDCIKHEDGTMTLVVDAVWSQRSTDCAFTHEVTIRLKPQGGFTYVSNNIKASESNIYPTYVSSRTNKEAN